MRIIQYKYGNLSEPCGPMALALGFFDGVHLGHRELLRRAKAEAARRGLPLGIFTFPAECREIKASHGRLYSTEQKLKMLQGLGIESVVLADFGSVKGLSPELFVKEVLVRDLGCRLAISGYNFSFGKDAKGDPLLLLRLMSELGGEALVVKEQTANGKRLSATAIRELLSRGDVEGAAELLGAPYHLTGKVERGLGIGRTIGTPTVNLAIQKGCPICPGVYHTLLPVSGKLYHGITNVGTCPTFGGRDVHAETTILDYSGDLYGTEVTVYFLSMLRAERKFDTGEQLRRQIARDIDEVRARARLTDYSRLL